MSLIKKKFIKEKNAKRLNSSAPSLSDVNGKQIITLGVFEIPLYLANQAINNSFICVPNEINFGTDLLMGMDILEANKAILNMEENNLIINKSITPLNTISSLQEKFGVVKTIRNNRKLGNKKIQLKLKEDCHIPPYSALLIQTHTAKCQNEEVIFCPFVHYQNSLYEGLTHINNDGNTEILFINGEAVPRTLTKGAKLGTVYLSDIAIIEENEIENEQPVNTINSKPTINQKDELKEYVNCPPEFEDEIINILSKYRDVIALPGEPYGETHLIKLALKLKEGTKPIALTPYKIPHSKEAKLDAEIEKMLREGTIAPTFSPWAFPVVIVAKPDDTIRVCIDYRRLNDVTISDAYPLPNIDTLLMGLGDSKYFTQLDLVQAYHQVPLTEESRPLTAFTVKRGHYEFRKAPYGLKQMPAVFQRLINNIFPNHKNVSSYLDDLLIHSADKEEHIKHLEEVLIKLREAGLKVKLKKCSFCKNSVKYLGFELTDKGFKPLDDKVAAINQFPSPKTDDDIRSFLGMAGYYRQYIPNFSSISKPLTNLLKKNNPFVWSEACEKAFQELKTLLSSAPVLIYPNFHSTFFVETDASNQGIGAVLSQKDEETGKLKPIAFASRLLKDAEENYSTTEKEALAIVWALKKFRYTIYGYPIVAITDHQPLVGLFSRTLPPGRLGRWALLIQEFGLKIKYQPGALNKVPDALSRHPVGTGEIQKQATTTLVSSENATKTKVKQPVPAWTIDELKRAQRSDEKISAIMEYVRNGKREEEEPLLPAGCKLENFKIFEEILYYVYEGSGTRTGQEVVKILIPEELLPNLFSLYHESSFIGHRGIEKTVERISRIYLSFNLQTRIKEYVLSCKKCLEHRNQGRKPAPTFQYEVIAKPFFEIHMDILGPLPATADGFKYIIVYVDRFTRYTLIDKLKDRSAISVANSIVSKVISEYQCPSVIVSDNGPEFLSNVITEICKLFSIRKTEIVSYHPAANGLAEAANKRIINALRVSVRKDQKNWSELLPLVQLALNSAYHDAIGDTPHFLLFLQDKIIPPELFISHVTNSEPHEYIDQFIQRQKLVYKVVQTNLTNEQARYTKKRNKKAQIYPIKEGGRVYLKTRVPPKICKKLYPRFEGPYRVLRDLGYQRFLVKNLINGKEKTVHADNTKIIPESCTYPALNKQAKLPFPLLEKPADFLDDSEEDDIYDINISYLVPPTVEEISEENNSQPPLNPEPSMPTPTEGPRYSLRPRPTTKPSYF